MALKKISVVVFCAVGFLISSSTVAQTIENKRVVLQSMEHKVIALNVELDHVNDKITLALNSSTKMCLSGYRGLVEDIKIVDGKFMALHYKLRGGSGVKMRQYVLLCIAENKIYRSMDILSSQSYEVNSTYDKDSDSLGSESGIYSVKFIQVKGSKQTKNHLTAIQREKVRYTKDVSRNKETIDTLRFSFDEKQKVLYTHYEALKGNFILEGSNKRIFKGERYPIIKLKNDEYIFIDNVWFLKAPNNYLVKASPDCE